MPYCLVWPGSRKIMGKEAAVSDRYIDVEGLRTRYWLAGSSGPPVVLIHGLGASAEIWSANIGALASRHRVYAPDLPGFGHTEMPSRMDFSPAAYSRFIQNFMTAQGIGRASIVGHSLGGGVALRVILDDPGRVERIVLVSCAGLGRDISLPLRIASLPFFDRVFFKPPLQVFTLFLHRQVYDPKGLPPVSRGSTTRCSSSRDPSGPLRGSCAPSPRFAVQGPASWNPSWTGSVRLPRPRSSSGDGMTASFP